MIATTIETALPADVAPVKSVLVTGGAGFIGSAVVRYLIAQHGADVVNYDALTYAANPATVERLAGEPRHHFVQADIRDRAALAGALAKHVPDVVMHLAAESHVDRSIDGPAAFIETNVVGTGVLLEAVTDYWRQLPPGRRERFRLLHVSTDEVYGALGSDGSFTETSPYRPNSPYAASKAAADHLVRAWRTTYGLPAIVTTASNNYGPYQFPEKLIPRAITRALHNEPIEVYGRGANVRDWIYVDDHAAALVLAAMHGRVGETYNIGSASELANIDVVKALCAVLDDELPDGAPHSRLITFVADRPGHDFRYSIDNRKICDELGWRPSVTHADGLRLTVRWYLDNRDWWEAVRHGRYRGERLGLAHASAK